MKLLNETTTCVYVKSLQPQQELKNYLFLEIQLRKFVCNILRSEECTNFDAIVFKFFRKMAIHQNFTNKITKDETKIKNQYVNLPKNRFC